MRRNTSTFLALAWIGLLMFITFFVAGIWNVKWELVEKGYYLLSFCGAVIMAFVLANVIRDKQDFEEHTNKRFED